MKLFIAFACLLALAYANEDAGVLRLESEVNVDNFQYVIELDNSNKQEQQGKLENPENWQVNGQYSWNSPEGEAVNIVYKADDQGYQVLSANPPLPTPPPIPEAIQRSLDWIAAHPPAQ